VPPPVVASVGWGAGREWRAGSSPRAAQRVYMRDLRVVSEFLNWVSLPIRLRTTVSLSAHLHLYSNALYPSPLSCL
jgi:hypothetical protein